MISAYIPGLGHGQLTEEQAAALMCRLRRALARHEWNRRGAIGQQKLAARCYGRAASARAAGDLALAKAWQERAARASARARQDYARYAGL